jgi:hypothetical protein
VDLVRRQSIDIQDPVRPGTAAEAPGRAHRCERCEPAVPLETIRMRGDLD